MEKRSWSQQYSANEERNPKRVKISAPRVDSARDIHILVAFHQDAEELRNGKSKSSAFPLSNICSGLSQFKLFLESIAYPQDGDTKVNRNLDVLKNYLDSQKPRDEDEEGLYV